MDPRYPPRPRGVPAQVRGFLDEQLPAGWPGIGALDHDEALAFTERWRATAARAWAARRGLLAGRVRRCGACRSSSRSSWSRSWREAGVPSMGPNDTFSLKMVGNILLALGDRGAEAPLPAAHPLGRGPLVPGLLRARQRLGPRRADDPAERERRRLGHQGPEDLADQGDGGQLDLRPGPDATPRRRSTAA